MTTKIFTSENISAENVKLFLNKKSTKNNIQIDYIRNVPYKITLEKRKPSIFCDYFNKTK